MSNNEFYTWLNKQYESSTDFDRFMYWLAFCGGACVGFLLCRL